MKKFRIIWLSVMLLSIGSSFAQDLGKIVIRNASEKYPKFIVSLNGVRIMNEYSEFIAFNYLDGKTYVANILQAGSSVVQTYTISSEPKYVSKYIIMQDNFGNYNLVLESKSLLALEPKEEIHPHHAMPTKTVVPTQSLTVPQPSVATTNTSIAAPTPPVVATPSVAEVTNISDAEFQPRYNSVKKESFDKDRLGKAKQIFDKEVLKTSQVIQLVKLFSFDDTKLDFAKWAYTRTIDQKNYYTVEDQLSFGRSKAELRDYIKKHSN